MVTDLRQVLLAVVANGVVRSWSPALSIVLLVESQNQFQIAEDAFLEIGVEHQGPWLDVPHDNLVLPELESSI